jgi:hypothetical protein
MMFGSVISQALYATAKLGIVDLLRDGPKTSPEIAGAIGAHEPSLHRLLRALTAIDILVEDDGDRYTATAQGDLLREDHPQSARATAIYLGAPFVWRPLGALEQAIATGKHAFAAEYGEDFYTYPAHHPEDAAAFKSMGTTSSGHAVPAILAAYDFSGFGTIVDVGGGEGAFLRGVLERHPLVRAVLFDLPPVVAGADALREPALAARCKIVGGDMFQSVPAGGDAYVLQGVIHNWSDDEAIQILRNCKEAMSGQGKLLLIEGILRPPNEPDFLKLTDLRALVLLTGRERTEAEFRMLLEASGLKVTRVMVAGGRSIVESAPV